MTEAVLTAGNTRITSVDIKAQVNWSLSLGVDVLESFLDDLADSQPIDFVHSETLDTQVTQDLLLLDIEVSKSNVYDIRRLQAWLDPVREGCHVGPRQTEQERDGHAVNVTAVARSRGVDVGVSVDLGRAIRGVS